MGRVVEQVWHAIDFLRKNGMIHFDCHHRNILTDGEDIYLTDFGLVLDKSFDLRQIELDFFAKHRYYSYGQPGHRLHANVLRCSAPQQKKEHYI